MPKGKRGCWVCGEPTWLTVQVWARRYAAEPEAPGRSRRERTIDSISRSFCMTHGLDAYEVAARAIERTVPAYLGCARCARKTSRRVQVTISTLRVPGRARKDLLESKLTAFCAECYPAAHAAARAPLEGAWNRTSSSASGDHSKNLDKARAASAAARKRRRFTSPGSAEVPVHTRREGP